MGVKTLSIYKFFTSEGVLLLDDLQEPTCMCKEPRIAEELLVFCFNESVKLLLTSSATVTKVQQMKLNSM